MNVTSFSQYVQGVSPAEPFWSRPLENVTVGGNSNWAFDATFWSLPFCHLSVKVSDSTSIPKDNHCWLKICVSKKYKSCVPYVAKGQQHSEDLVDFCQKQFPSFLFHRVYVINPIWWKADWETFWLFVWPQYILPQLVVIKEWVTPRGYWGRIIKGAKNIISFLLLHQVDEKLNHLFGSVAKCQTFKQKHVIYDKFSTEYSPHFSPHFTYLQCNTCNTCSILQLCVCLDCFRLFFFYTDISAFV